MLAKAETIEGHGMQQSTTSHKGSLLDTKIVFLLTALMGLATMLILELPHSSLRELGFGIGGCIAGFIIALLVLEWKGSGGH